MSAFLRIDDERADLAGVFQADIFPVLSGIDRFINAGAVSGVAANGRFARARRKRRCDRMARQRSRRWTKCLPYRTAASNSLRHRSFSKLRPRPRRNNRCPVRPARPSIASARPPRNGPTWRHCIPEKSFGSICGAGAEDVLGDGAAHRISHRLAQATKKQKKNEDYANSWRVSSRLTRVLQLQTRRQSAAVTIFCMLSPPISVAGNFRHYD